MIIICGFILIFFSLKKGVEKSHLNESDELVFVYRSTTSPKIERKYCSGKRKRLGVQNQYIVL